MITLFAVPLGLAGLGGVWVEAQAVASAPAWAGDAAYAGAAVAWLILTVAYLAQGLRRPGMLGADLRNPVTGPLTAYPPVVGMLMVPHLGLYAHTAAEWICGVFVATLMLLVAAMLTNLFRGDVPLAAVHPGYFLPYAAGASITSIALDGIGARTAALTAVGAGLFLWVVLSALFFTRLATQEALPAAATPLLSVLLASPATAGIAWFAAHENRIDPVIDALAGVILLLILVQVHLLPDYRRVGFTLGFWAFAFPIALTTNFGVRWLNGLHIADSEAWAWLLTSLATVSIAALAARSLVLVFGGPRT
ncbi:SLAC1 family transporter [Streptomyces antimycoticus]|uniref:SLAC1 family transporter n=1 Tax=Streptomyces antimycoticus TaxID=68175 RepID=UPI00138667BD